MADRVLLRALCDQILLTRVWPTNCDLLLRACKFKKKKPQNPRGWEHTHTHTCVAESVSSKLHRKVKGFEGLAAQLLRARAHTHSHTLPNRSIEGCTPGSRVTRAWPTKRCCEHTHVYCREIRVAPTDRTFTRAWPTNCCCEHTHVDRRMNHLRAAPKDQGSQGFARPTAAASIHTRAAK